MFCSLGEKQKTKGKKEQNTQMFLCSHDDLRIRCFFVCFWNKKSKSNLERNKMWENRKQTPADCITSLSGNLKAVIV